VEILGTGAIAPIARGYNLPIDVKSFVESSKRILKQLHDELGWMYETVHSDGKTKARINYTVWSECFACPECGNEIVFLDEALDQESKRVRDVFPCPKCDTELTKDNLQRVLVTLIDPATGTPWKRVRLTPILISYSKGSTKYEKHIQPYDQAVLNRIAQLPLPSTVPTEPFPIDSMYHGSRLAPKGFSRIHHLFLPRQAQALGRLWELASAETNAPLRSMILFLAEQAIWGMSVLNRYQPIMHGRPDGSQVNRYLSGVYYVGSQIAEVSPWYILDGKLDRLEKAFRLGLSQVNHTIISTRSASGLALPSRSIDYVFTDPPFGENIFYADLNLLVESWHHVKTNSAPEAIVDSAKGKGLSEYQHLMQRCFEEYHRVLKPGRWMTVVFHNSRNAVWNAIQEAMLAAGFVVADVRTLDKQQGSYRQVTSTAVKQDLIISAYRPGQGLEERFSVIAGTEDSAWEFVRSHLLQVPGFVPKAGRVQVIAERQPYVLYDRMVAFHVQRGYAVPLSSAEFHAGLRLRFPERDGMYFLPDQVTDYDRKRIEISEVEQLELFVSDEKSAIQWVRRQLESKPTKYQDLQPHYTLVSRKKCTNPCSCETIVCTIPVASAAWCDRQA